MTEFECAGITHDARIPRVSSSRHIRRMVLCRCYIVGTYFMFVPREGAIKSSLHSQRGCLHWRVCEPQENSLLADVLGELVVRAVIPSAEQ